MVREIVARRAQSSPGRHHIGAGQTGAAGMTNRRSRRQRACKYSMPLAYYENNIRPDEIRTTF
jgi:hypothetical protein